jgi:hypothetical protein
MTRTRALCGLGLVARGEICDEAAAYRIEARTSDARSITMHLCSTHIHRAWNLSQLAMDRKFPGQNRKVKSIHLHQLVRVAAAEAAS